MDSQVIIEITKSQGLEEAGKAKAFTAMLTRLLKQHESRNLSEIPDGSHPILLRIVYPHIPNIFTQIESVDIALNMKVKNDLKDLSAALSKIKGIRILEAEAA